MLINIESQVFNQNANKYDQWYDKYHLVYQSELFAIERLLPRRTNAVEIGVGTGRFAGPFSIRTGLDPSENMLKLAKLRNINGVQGVAEELPFCNESFHLVLMVSTICFLKDIERCFKEIYRVLRSGGEFVIGFIDKLSHLGRGYERKKETSVFLKDANFYTPEELTELLIATYFNDIFFVQTIFRPLDEIHEMEPVKNGYGKGSFVVVRSVKF
jgi:ubiquinone/menaquinone biosynthesis C-methylase UbiE